MVSMVDEKIVDSFIEEREPLQSLSNLNETEQVVDQIAQQELADSTPEIQEKYLCRPRILTEEEINSMDIVALMLHVASTNYLTYQEVKRYEKKETFIHEDRLEQVTKNISEIQKDFLPHLLGFAGAFATAISGFNETMKKPLEGVAQGLQTGQGLSQSHDQSKLTPEQSGQQQLYDVLSNKRQAGQTKTNEQETSKQKLKEVGDAEHQTKQEMSR